MSTLQAAQLVETTSKLDTHSTLSQTVLRGEQPRTTIRIKVDSIYHKL